MPLGTDVPRPVHESILPSTAHRNRLAPVLCLRLASQHPFPRTDVEASVRQVCEHVKYEGIKYQTRLLCRLTMRYNVDAVAGLASRGACVPCSATVAPDEPVNLRGF